MLTDPVISEVPEIVCFEHYHHPLRLERVRRAAAAYDWISPDQQPSWKPRNHQPVSLVEVTSNLPELSPAALSNIPETLIIFFWTSSAVLTVAPSESGNKKPSLVGPDGEVIGSMAPLALGNDAATAGQRRGQHEFIVIGSRRNQFSDPVLLVLQIEWQHGIAYRVNSGEVLERSWEAAAPTWKLVALG